MLDVVGAGCGEARLLRHPRADVGIRAAVPERLDLTGDHAAVVLHAGLDAHGRTVLGDRVELLVHGQRDPHRLANDQGADGHERFELDVQLGAEPASEKRRAHAHAVLGPSQQAADLTANERRALRGGMDGQFVVTVHLGQRDDRLERGVHHLAASEGVLENAV